jgi:hypothetical protein
MRASLVILSARTEIGNTVRYLGITSASRSTTLWRSPSSIAGV